MVIDFNRLNQYERIIIFHFLIYHNLYLNVASI